MSYQEIGDVMGLTASGVKMIELRALRKLKNNARVMAAIRKLLEGRS